MTISRRSATALPLLGALTILAAADEEWLPFGQGATVRKSGETVTLDYKVTPGQLSMAVLPTGEGKLAGMTRLQFRLRTDGSTVVAVMLSEKKPGGGDYSVAFWSPKDQWQQIDLTPADFAVNDGPKDPKDPDGRLDADQVEHIAILDMGQLFSQMSATSAPIAFARLTGEHKLDLEGLHVVTESAKSQERGTVIDDFHRGFLAWFTPGGADLALSKSGNPLNKAALEFRYQQDPAKLAVVLHGLGQTDLRGARELAFDVASSRDAHFILTLEEQKVDGKAGPRYNLDFTLSAGQTGHMSMPLGEFTLADDCAPDPAGHLDVSKVRTISLADVSGLLNGSTEKNTIWLADLRAR